MEELETDRKHQLDKLRLKLDKIRQSLNEDDTGNMNNVISKNSPEACLTYLTRLEKKGDPQTDHKHLCRIIDFYTRVFSNMPLGKHCQNETYARMLVRFAELKAIQDVKEAEDNFNLARSHCPNFAFVHISYAEFEHSHGNTKKAIHILQRAIEEDAKPKELLDASLLNLQSGKTQLACSEDKENALAHNKVRDSTKQCSESKVSRISDGTGELHLPGIFSSGREPFNALSDDQLPSWRTGPQKRAVCLPGRVPILPFSIPETDDDDSEGKLSKKEDVFIPKSVFRQTPGPSSSAMITMSSSKKTVTDGDFHLKPPNVSPDPRSWVDEDQAIVDSTTTLLHRPDKRGTDKMEDTTSTFNQMISSYSPESCQRYLCNLEKRGNPHTDLNFLNKLKANYDKVFAKLPMVKYSKNESYVRMLVRFAELKGIEDPEEAEDHFIVLRSHCKGLAFVHVAHAQFEVSQGNTRKAISILHKASTLKAKPVELLETALANLKSGKKELMLVSTDQEESPAAMQTSEPLSVAASGGNYAVQAPGRVPVARPALPPQPVSKEPSSEWKIPAAVSRHVSSEEKHTSPPDARPAPCRQDSLPTPLPLPSTLNTVRNQVYQTPNNPMRDPYGNNGYITPVVKRNPEVTPSTAHTSGPAQNHSKALHQVSCTQTPQASINALSNESITIKGKQFFVLKMIGRGGSSKVYQVLDHKKQLFAVKQVNLEEADAQTVESYKNEIEHLNRLQQYSEQIIKLYDYEITNSCIYMLMECGNLDLNTWLKKRKTVNQLERKYYWKNMLEAVSTIHKHGIVHSDLKPANFVIVNASLKLIDFGIANQIQPDVTSIMKDSQVGTINYMPPEAIRYTTSKHGKASSKISPKGDVWSLGCILYCMTYGKTPFQSITNQINKLHAITDPTFDIEFPDIPEKDLLDVLKRCLVRDPRERISIAELLDHPYIQFQPQASPEPEHLYNSDLKKILNDLAALQSPNSIVRAANNLAKMCNSGRKLDVAECVKSSHQS